MTPFPNWQPRWNRIDQASSSLIVWNDGHGMHVNFSAVGPDALGPSWAAEWLELYHRRQGAEELSHEHDSFFYVLLGGMSQEAAILTGTVDGRAVLEVGFGSAPAGKPMGVAASQSSMILSAIALLRQ